MILFVNFAPLAFFGGAEKWMNDIAKAANIYEESLVISVDSQIANIYGQAILKRKFEKRVNNAHLVKNISLTPKSFIPFTNQWNEVKTIISQSRIIYIKFEILETFIVIYFGGLKVLKKTIAGIHSPFMYSNPQKTMDRLHNLVYSSTLVKNILHNFKKVHVLNKKDFKRMKEIFNLSQVIYVPNGITEPKTSSIKQSASTLKVLFVGELSERKGIDRLLKIIELSPLSFLFTIVGDGPLQKEVTTFIKNKNNCKYRGYIAHSQMFSLYDQSEVLLLPSRAESMSFAVLEALSHGLVIVNSSETSLDLGKNIEYPSSTIAQYIQSLQKIFSSKRRDETKSMIRTYFKNNFSTEIVYPQLLKNVLEIKV